MTSQRCLAASRLVAASSLLPSESNLLPPPSGVLGLRDSGPRLADGPPTLLHGYSELGPHDLSLFLHSGILQQQTSAATLTKPTPVMSLRDLPREILLQTHTAPANEYLLDPQTLVPEIPRVDLERLLEFHAASARIRLYLLVLDTHQKLPESTNLDAVAHGALTRQRVCLAVYPLGEPWRARFLVSQAVHQFVPSASLADLAEDCIKDALQATDAAQQLQRFTVRLSTRLFWLEKSLPAPVPNSPPAPLHEVSAQAPAITAAVLGQPYSLVAAGIMLAGVTLLGTGIAVFRLLRARRDRQAETCVWILPDPEVIPRLGGAFSGGAGAVISFRD